METQEQASGLTCRERATVLAAVKGWVLAMLSRLRRDARGSGPGFAAFNLRCAR